MKNIKIVAIVLLLSCSVPEQEQPVIAKVGDSDLTVNEIIEEISAHPDVTLSAADVREYVLRWINDEVLYQEALALKIDQDDKLKRELERIKRQLIINNLIDLTLNNDVKVTDEEINDYYQANQEEFILSDDLVHAYHILTNTRKEARAITARIKKGELFEEIAEHMASDSLGTLDWDLGYFSESEIIPEISKQVFSIPAGNLSPPIKSAFGYHLIKVVDKMKKGEVKRLEQVRDEIRLMLEQQKKQDNYQRFLLQTKSKFNVLTNFEILDFADLDSLLKNGEMSN